MKHEKAVKSLLVLEKSCISKHFLLGVSLVFPSSFLKTSVLYKIKFGQ